jgi:hypothetical protein
VNPAYQDRSRRHLVGLAAALALVVLLVVAGGWLAWQGLRTAPPDPDTAPAGAARADTAAAPATLADEVGGVPWGFALDVEGAVAAASVAVAATGHQQVVFDPDRFDTLARQLFTPDEARVQARQVDAARVQFEVSGWDGQPASRRTYHLAVLAARPMAFDPAAGTATVEVWAMTLVGIGDRGGGVFTTSTVTLTTDDGGWRIAGLDSQPGPTPMVDATPDPPGRIRQLTRDALPTAPLPYRLDP